MTAQRAASFNLAVFAAETGALLVGLVAVAGAHGLEQCFSQFGLTFELTRANAQLAAWFGMQTVFSPEVAPWIIGAGLFLVGLSVARFFITFDASRPLQLDLTSGKNPTFFDYLWCQYYDPEGYTIVLSVVVQVVVLTFLFLMVVAAAEGRALKYAEDIWAGKAPNTIEAAHVRERLILPKNWLATLRMPWRQYVSRGNFSLLWQDDNAFYVLANFQDKLPSYKSVVLSIPKSGTHWFAIQRSAHLTRRSPPPATYDRFMVGAFASYIVLMLFLTLTAAWKDYQRTKHLRVRASLDDWRKSLPLLIARRLLRALGNGRSVEIISGKYPEQDRVLVMPAHLKRVAMFPEVSDDAAASIRRESLAHSVVASAASLLQRTISEREGVFTASLLDEIHRVLNEIASRDSSSASVDALADFASALRILESAERSLRWAEQERAHASDLDTQRNAFILAVVLATQAAANVFALTTTLIHYADLREFHYKA